MTLEYNSSPRYMDHSRFRSSLHNSCLHDMVAVGWFPKDTPHRLYKLLQYYNSYSYIPADVKLNHVGSNNLQRIDPSELNCQWLIRNILAEHINNHSNCVA